MGNLSEATDELQYLGRILVVLAGLVLTGYLVFGQTPELDNVKNAWMYRLSFMLTLLRGWVFLWFDLLGAFPISEDNKWTTAF